ncbi:MAG: gliding motility lipoprotein GldH [Odoribacteraceae bacterium]|jgi:gliding motility-associated lipoprotein GldH|nr:gliding motility lipoprotein GldH [Odoribacteraceae bacterium]
MKRLALPLLLLLFGCHATGPRPVLEEFRDFPGERWDRDDPVSFLLDASSAGPLAVTLFLRHTVDLDHANLSCLVSLSRDGLWLAEERADFRLADDKGQWTGKGSIIKTVARALETPFEVDAPGKYRLDVRHWMRQKELKAITSIGIQVHGKE